MSKTHRVVFARVEYQTRATIVVLDDDANPAELTTADIDDDQWQGGWDVVYREEAVMEHTELEGEQDE